MSATSRPLPMPPSPSTSDRTLQEPQITMAEMTDDTIEQPHESLGESLRYYCRLILSKFVERLEPKAENEIEEVGELLKELTCMHFAHHEVLEILNLLTASGSATWRSRARRGGEEACRRRKQRLGISRSSVGDPSYRSSRLYINSCRCRRSHICRSWSAPLLYVKHSHKPHPCTSDTDTAAIVAGGGQPGTAAA